MLKGCEFTLKENKTGPRQGSQEVVHKPFITSSQIIRNKFVTGWQQVHIKVRNR